MTVINSSHGLKYSLLMRLCFNTARRVPGSLCTWTNKHQKSDFELEEGLLRQQAGISGWMQTAARVTASS